MALKEGTLGIEPKNHLGRSFMKMERKNAAQGQKGFVGSVLLANADWDRVKLIEDLQSQWGICVEESEGQRDNQMVFHVGKMIAAVALIPAPVPGNEAEENAAGNYLWPGAVEAAENHKAHLVAAIMGTEPNMIEQGKLFVKLLACCCNQKNVLGIYSSGTVFEPQFYEDCARVMKDDELPLLNWIWFGLWRRKNGICCYTYGMDVFGKDEMEVLDANANPSDVRNFLLNLAAYVLENDVTLKKGETIGFSEDDKHSITRSKGAALPGMTLKISY